MDKPLILGSASPRRKEILGYFSLPFEVVPSPFDEASIPFQGDPERYVRNIAEGKAQSLAPRFPNQIVITGDTIVYKDPKVYLKPKSDEEAFATLSALVGTWHTVYTAVCAMRDGDIAVEVQRTDVEFVNLTPDQIHRYKTAVQSSDKAGGYMLQEKGSLIVKSIAGCPYNAIGLPIQALATVLHHMGVDLWNSLD